ncbi:hypothetical protein FXO38_22007 [Capsicum annuum]|nr:hypothetical protein FXO38_22007 [Capsicum annuum]
MSDTPSLVVGSPDTPCTIDILIGSSSSSSTARRLVISIVGEKFVPNGHSISKIITETFKERQDATGYTWRGVTEFTRKFYWNEFMETEMGRELNSWEIFKKVPPKKDGSFVDVKSKSINGSPMSGLVLSGQVEPTFCSSAEPKMQAMIHLKALHSVLPDCSLDAENLDNSAWEVDAGFTQEKPPSPRPCLDKMEVVIATALSGSTYDSSEDQELDINRMYFDVVGGAKNKILEKEVSSMRENQERVLQERVELEVQQRVEQEVSRLSEGTRRSLYQSVKLRRRSNRRTSVPVTLEVMQELNLEVGSSDGTSTGSGHAPLKVLKNVSGFNSSQLKEHVCTVFPIIKQTRLSFPVSHSYAPTAFALVHVNVWGLYRVPTHDVKRCLGFATVVKRSEKFCARAIPTAMLGYSSSQKGYILYDLAPKSSCDDPACSTQINTLLSSSMDHVPLPVSSISTSPLQPPPAELRSSHGATRPLCEIIALEENKTWSMVDVTPSHVPIRYKWVFKVKYKSNDKVNRYKARLNIFQMDVHNAFLLGDLDEEWCVVLNLSDESLTLYGFDAKVGHGCHTPSQGLGRDMHLILFLAQANVLS